MVLTTRFDGGVAFLWISTAILIAALLRTPTRQWWEPLIVCGVVSFIVTGFLGLGWIAALPLALINVLEGALAAWVFQRLADPKEPMQSLGWLFRFVLAVGVVAPLVAAVLAAASMVALQLPASNTLSNFYSGHALGNLTFTPLALLVTGRRAWRQTKATVSARWLDIATVVSVVFITSVAVFFQNQLPLLFLPVLAVVLAAFRCGREGAAIAIVVLAGVGGVATALGFGPVTLVAGPTASRILFLQFYLAATVLTALPVVADLQKRRRTVRKLRESEARFRMLAEHSTDILMHLTKDGRLRYVSPSVEQIGGYSAEALVGRTVIDLIAPEAVAGVRANHQRVIEEKGATVRYRYLGLTASGEKRWFETLSRALLDEAGSVEGVISIARDVADQMAHEQGLLLAATTDTLTGLPNRRALEIRVQERQRRRRADDELGDCIAIIDIDHFKQVNDIYGHHVGDDVLRTFARIAPELVRQDDLAVRLGGEEFVLFFPNSTVEHALQISERLRATIAATPIMTEAGLIRITVSGGVAPVGPQGLEPALKTADAALYRAKRLGRDQMLLAA